MKNATKKIMISVLAAAVLAAAPIANFAPVSLVADAATYTVPSGLKAVTEKGKLEVTVPEKVSTDYNVKAYEMLQLVIPEDTVWTAGTAMTNNADSKNMYIVTNEFAPFFAAAKTAYTTDGSTLPTTDTLYLTYNFTDKQLVLSADKPSGTENEDYIVINNKAHSAADRGRLEKTYFEADLVSRIVSSAADASETTAGAARLFSDWASRYITEKPLTADATASKVTSSSPEKTVFQFTDLIYGYYVVVSSDSTNNSDQSVLNQSILNVPMATGVTLKATPITIDKSVENFIDANSKNNGSPDANANTARLDVDTEGGTDYDKITANVGDILKYTVRSHIPSLTGYDLVKAASESKLLGIVDDDILTEVNFASQITNKYIYTFRDTMKMQDFIPVNITDVTKYGKAVDGLKMEVYDAKGTSVEKTYIVKEFGEGKYYIVPETSSKVEDAIGRLWETDYNATDKKNFFAVNFDLAAVKANEIDGRNVVFTYYAELKGETGNSNADNTAQFTYSNDPFSASSNDTITDNNNVYTYDLKIDKIFSDGATTDLYDKVTFKLFSDADKTKSIQFTGSNGQFVRADSDDTAATDRLSLNSTDGKLQLHGLGEGTYYLVEQENADLTAKGYNVINPITVVITAKDGSNILDQDNFDLFQDASVKSSASLDGVAMTITKLDNNNEYGIEFNVLNQKGFTLPLTGEFGNWMLAIAGIVLVAVGGTVIVLANRKKKDTAASYEE